MMARQVASMTKGLYATAQVEDAIDRKTPWWRMALDYRGCADPLLKTPPPFRSTVLSRPPGRLGWRGQPNSETPPGRGSHDARSNP